MYTLPFCAYMMCVLDLAYRFKKEKEQKNCKQWQLSD